MWGYFHKCVLFVLMWGYFEKNVFYFCKSIKKIMLFKWVKLPSGCVVPGSCVLIVTFGCCFVNYWGGCLGGPIQSMVHLGRSTMPGWYKAYQIDRSEQQVHLQHLLHLEWSGYSFGYCTWCPVCSTSWLGSSLGVGPLPVGELNQNWSVLFFIKVGEFFIIKMVK